MAEPSQAQVQRRLGSTLTRWSLIGAVAAATLIALGIALAADGGSHAHGASAESAQSSPTQKAAVRPTATTRDGTASSTSGLPPASAGTQPSASGGARRQNVAEVADPEEARSFPAPAGAHHKAAAAPAKASEQIVAAGAPSDAEVKQELAQMQAAERSAKQTQQQRLKPVPGGNSVGGNGTIPIPQGVPEVVQRVIAGANAIADFPYVFGGGHASFVDNAYDCSGSVSYALAAGGLLSAPETSGALESWGAPGPGRYITVEAAAGHVYMYVDGIMFNTAGRSGVYASRWQVSPVDNSGYVTRHWPGL